MPRSVDIAPCDHEGRDYHRVLPTRHQRRRALRPAGRRTPRQLRPPSPRHRAPAARRAGGVRSGEERGATAGDHVSVSRSCAFPRCRCPATRVSGSACPAAGSGRRSSGTRPRWCTWPARSSWARTAPPWPGGSACPRSRCTRPTCRPTRGRTGSAGRRGVRLAVAARHPQRRRAHAGPVHGHRDRPARPGHRQRLAVGPRRGHAALRPGQAQPGAAHGAARQGGSRRADRGIRRPPGHREAGRAAGRDHRAGRGPAGHRGGRAGRGHAAPAHAGRHLPRRAPGRGAGGHLRQPGRVRAQRAV